MRFFQQDLPIISYSDPDKKNEAKMKMRTKVARFVLALLFALSALFISASAALADKPIKVEYTVTGSNTFPDTCPFTFYDDAILQASEKYFYDESGGLTRIEGHYVEQDTFYVNADGIRLESLPYSFSGHWYFDSSGNLTKLIVSGVLVKVPLPDGSKFQAAGQVDFVNHPGATSLLIPDKGNTVNLDKFCEALAP
jgi:hypothetical protein